MRRSALHGQLTLIHGDAHPGNVFWPKPGRVDQAICFVDWETAKRSIGPVDIAYLLLDADCLHLRELVLNAYHDALLANGVTGYSRGVCNSDFVLALQAMPFVLLLRGQYDWLRRVLDMIKQIS